MRKSEIFGMAKLSELREQRNRLRSQVATARSADKALTQTIEEYQNIKNRGLSIVLECVACDSRAAARTPTSESGLDLLMSQGWFILDRKHQVACCPLHNPANRMFIGYHTPEGIRA